jgi:hypothetical protein
MHHQVMQRVQTRERANHEGSVSDGEVGHTNADFTGHTNADGTEHFVYDRSRQHYA